MRWTIHYRILCLGKGLLTLALLFPSASFSEGDHKDHDEEGAKDHANEKEHEHGHEKSGHGELSDENVKELNIPVAKAEGGPIDSYLVILGKINLHPDKALHLHSKYAGVVRDVYKTTGDRVQAGDVLARVENNIGIQTSELVSTIDGLIINKTISSGQSVSEEVEAFTIADMSLVMATLVAYPRDMNRLSVGQKVFLQSTRNGPMEVADISYISPILDEKTRTANLNISLKNESGLWRPGQFIVGKVQVGKRDVAVRVKNELAYLSGQPATNFYVRNGKRFIERNVAIAEGDLSFAEVASGLSPGEEYLAMPSRQIEEMINKQAGDAHQKK